MLPQPGLQLNQTDKAQLASTLLSTLLSGMMHPSQRLTPTLQELVVGGSYTPADVLGLPS